MLLQVVRLSLVLDVLDVDGAQVGVVFRHGDLCKGNVRRGYEGGVTFLLELALELVDLLFFGRVVALLGLVEASVETEERGVRVYLRVGGGRLDRFAFGGCLFHFN